MEIDKRQVLELLVARGEETRVHEADEDLPDLVDTEQHGEVLRRLGLEPSELARELGQGGPGGTVDGLLGD